MSVRLEVCDSSWRNVIGASGKAGLRNRQPRYRDTSASRSSLPASTSRITPMATTSLEIDATRAGSSAVTLRPVARSATPATRTAVSPRLSKAMRTAASGSCRGIVASTAGGGAWAVSGLMPPSRASAATKDLCMSSHPFVERRCQ